MENFSIDIVVPAFRMEEAKLLEIFFLPKPEGFTVCYYFISDNNKAVIPQSLISLQERGEIHLLVHAENRGPAAARNTGIRAGSGRWILFLDDDIQPKPDLLIQYAAAILNNESAIGFVGQTIFPKPFNAVTLALETGGWISHFTAANKYPSLKWAPTANILLNRTTMDTALFDESLRESGEDIQFLVRNCLLFKEEYISLPEAIVYHPWWNAGAVQTSRMLRYGRGASEIARKEPVSFYTFPDFTNTTETALLLLLLIPAAMLFGFLKYLLIFFLVLLISEFLTNWCRAIRIGKTFSPAVAFQLMWAKNCYEAGFLVRSLETGYLKGFARRIDMGFTKKHPGAFRTNRWKIIKLALITVLFLIAVNSF